MKDNEILEQIRDLYSVKEPDVLSRLSFAGIEMIQPEKPKVTKTVFSVAVIYAAVCLVLIIAVPFIIGGNDSPMNPGIVPGTGEVSTDGTTTTETTEETTENNTVTLNTDLFDEYMMTYAELSEKHGKLVEFVIPNGGGHYKFENGYGYYWFYPNADWSGMTTHPEGGFEYAPIDEDTLCRGIDLIAAEDLFNEEFETLSIEAISNIEGLNYEDTVLSGITSTKTYTSYFTYDGWNNDKVKLRIYHDDKDMIDLTSKAKFNIHPLDADAEETQ